MLFEEKKQQPYIKITYLPVYVKHRVKRRLYILFDMRITSAKNNLEVRCTESSVNNNGLHYP